MRYIVPYKRNINYQTVLLELQQLSGITKIIYLDESNLCEQWERFQRHIKLILNRVKTKLAYLLLRIGEKGRDVHGT